MNPKSKPVNHDAEEVVVKVFRHSGVKLSADDPIVCLILMQRQSIMDLAVRQAENDAAFFERLATHEKAITGAAAELEKHREQILLELVQKSDLKISEVEDRVYAGVRSTIGREYEAAAAVFLGRLKKMLVVLYVLIGILLLLEVGILIRGFT